MAYKETYMGEYVDNSSGAFPQNQFGGFEHTMFLGCSVMGFTAKVGWNQQVSELTVQLVQDLYAIPSNAPQKVYFDKFLRKQYTRAADPGFFSYNSDAPRVGSAVYFRVADFEFCGLLQSWTQTSGTGGNPTYQVTIVDPRQILENAQLIIGDYAGGLPQNLYNVFNIYGFMERFNGYACSSTDIGDSSFGSPAGAYGGADLNNNGMPVHNILLGTKLLTSSIPREVFSNYNDAYGYPFSPYGRLVYRGAQTGSDGCGVMAADTNGISFFLLDMSEVKAPAHLGTNGVIPNYVRRNGTSISIMELLNSLSDDLGFDYYIELIPIGGGGSVPTKIIKVRTVSRATQPIFGVIDDFIGDCENNNILLGVNRNKGRELRNEDTASLVIGGNQQSIYQTDNTYAVPFFGFNYDGTAIYPTINADGFWEFDVSIVSLKQQLLSETPTVDYITIDERELLVAFGGKDSWEYYAEYDADSFLKVLASYSRKKFGEAAADMVAGNVGAKLARDNKQIVQDDATRMGSSIQKDIQTVFAFISSFATEYYGKKFLVGIPYTCYFVDTEAATYAGEAKIRYTDVPSDGGWAWSTGVIDLPHPSWTTLFTLEDNRLGAFVKFTDTDQIDFAHLAEGDYIYQSGSLHVKAEVDQELVFFSVGDDPFLTPRVVVNIPQAVVNTLDGVLNNDLIGRTGRAAAMAKNKADGQPAGENEVEEQSKNVGGITVKEYAEHIPKWPDKFAIPLMNTTRVYGPWATNARSLPAGTVRIEQDDGLVPWEYGNGLLLNTVGQYKANSNLTQMQVAEMGTVTVAGYPTMPLGAELGTYSDTYLQQVRVVENRAAFSHEKFEATDVIAGETKIHTYVSNALNIPAGLDLGQGIYGPNITDINVSVTDRGVQTTYTLRTYTPKYGRMEKYNSDRIKQFSKNVSKRNRTLANNVAQFTSNISKRLSLIEQEKRPLAEKGKKEKNESPHELLVGQTVTHPTNTDLYRTIIETTDTTRVVDELSYPTGKSIASLDVLFRPISIKGSDDLPQFAGYSYHSVSGHPAGAQPPVSIAGSPIYNFKVDGETENPFANPVSVDAKSPAQFSDSPERGHDIDILARDVDGNSVPTGTLIMPIAGGAEGKEADYQEDYRTFALRGPLMLQSWGFDLDGKPIPNAVDTFSNASQGTFATTSLEDKFFDGFLHKSPTWPVGPVDLRFDRKRGVWTTPPSYRLMVTQLSGTLSPGGTQQAYVIDGNIIYDTNGISIDPANDPLESKPTVLLTEKIQSSYNSGEKVLTYFNPDLNEYWPLGGAGNSGIQISDTGCSGSPGDLFTNTNFYNANQIIFGTGLDVISTGIYNGTTTATVALGLTISNSSGCPDLGGYSTVADDHHFNRILIGTGLHAVMPSAGMLGPPYTECDTHIALAIDFYNTGENPQNLSDCSDPSVSAPALQASKKAVIYLDDTISVSDFTSSENPCVQHDCGVKLHVSAASITTQNTNDCPTYFTSTFSNGEQVDSFKFSKGLWSILPDPGDTTIHQVGLAIPMYNTNTVGSTPTTYQISGISEIAFGGGLAVETSGDCGALVWFTGVGDSGVEMCNTETCPYTTASITADSNLHKPTCEYAESYQVTTLKYGVGLQYTHHDTTSVDMVALAIPFSDVNGANIRENVAMIKLGSGLVGTVIGSDANACELQIDYDLQASDSNGCVDQSNTTSTSQFNILVSQKGLLSWQTPTDEANGIVNIGLSTKHVNVDSGVVTPANAEYVGGPFYWGQGLNVKGTEDCGLLIEATGTGSGVWLEYSGGCPGTLETDAYHTSKIMIGSGLSHWRQDNQSFIGLSIPVHGRVDSFDSSITKFNDDVVNLVFRSGIKIEATGGCGISIDAGTRFYDVDFCEDATNFNVDVDTLRLFPDIGIGQGLAVKGHSTDDALGLIYLSMDVNANADISSFNFNSGLFVTTGDISDCNQAEINVGLIARNADACYDDSYSIGGDAIFSKVSFEKGLKPWQTPTDASNGLVRVALAMDVEAGSQALPGSSSLTDVGHLIIGSGLKVVATGDCGALISTITSSGTINTVGDSVCNTDEDNNQDELTTKLIFGLGLSHNRTEVDGPTARIGLDLKIKENKDLSGDTLASGVAAIWLGPGLETTIPETCAVGMHVMISGLYDPTCMSSVLTKDDTFSWNKLRVKEGLLPYVVNEGGNTKRLELGLGITNRPVDLPANRNGSTSNLVSSNYAWGSGIAIYPYGSCGVKIVAGLEAEYKDECYQGGCGGDSDIMFGSRLSVYSGLCIEQITDNELALSLNFGVNDDQYINKLNLVSGLEKTPGEPPTACEVNYMVGMRMTNDDVCYGYLCARPADNAYMYSGIYVGQGLIGCNIDEEDDGRVAIGLDMTVGGVQHNAEIATGAGLTAVKDDADICTVIISCSGGMDATFCVVTNVTCSGNEIWAEKMRLTFNECGYLSATGEC